VNILDTDALSHHMKSNATGRAIGAHVAARAPDFRITAVSAFEMVDGALQLHERLRTRRRELIPGFNLIQEVVEYLGGWRGQILPYDGEAERLYAGFPARLRQELGDDARIAAIAMARGASVWTCNVGDYTKIPDLIVVQAETGVVVS
jgi:predicted nucleic acid-binding protein